MVLACSESFEDCWPVFLIFFVQSDDTTGDIDVKVEFEVLAMLIFIVVEDFKLHISGFQFLGIPTEGKGSQFGPFPELCLSGRLTIQAFKGTQQVVRISSITQQQDALIVEGSVVDIISYNAGAHVGANCNAQPHCFSLMFGICSQSVPAIFIHVGFTNSKHHVYETLLSELSKFRKAFGVIFYRMIVRHSHDN